ncbi:hypothetical protein P700755_000754 [Psychroflexus torquis ATCC 700755]|jgi:hypothetical protein|uniref:Uncharacterized protein n=1 Tax=Psychroflexus torquis (strain ATCC 700755 / CIP 106069 / ACAM 623) TaxID=313595 RepID=K4ID02_PSYTT|nr:hypothetical protein [Psychroflexus torquis]AFU67758.1 hypothetical protein P700755_000754 [Psychroflexus torquis ATCC 700755]
MDSKSYLSLNSWLQKADSNYIEGRLLWLNWLVDGSCNLLWLACEQMIKILLLQEKIDTYSAESTNMDELHKVLDKKGKKLGHDVGKLIAKINAEYPELDITKYKTTLEKLQEYFYRRYVINKGSSISMNMLNEVDEFYFLLRSKIYSDVGLGTIDEIFIQKKHNRGHFLPAFSYSYLHNKSFRSRKHRSINQMGPDGKVYMENGE